MSRTMIVFACCAVMACGSSPQDPCQPADSLFYSNPDSAWKVLQNLRYAYVSRNSDIYQGCFRDDFEFHMPAEFWADYSLPPDGVPDSFWGLEIEMASAELLFGSVESIELDFSGGSDSIWSEDPSGQSWSLVRDFDLRLTAGSDSAGSYGSQEYICRQDSTGHFYIWQWWDNSSPDAPWCWTELKGGIPPQAGDSLYYEPADSVWKVIANLRTAYENRDLERYGACLSSDFEFWFMDMSLPAPVWTSWDLETEGMSHLFMFSDAEIDSLVLDLEPLLEVPSDSFPGGIECVCPFDLKLYIYPGSGFRATGEARFTLLQDSTDCWTIVSWRDESEFDMPREAITWADIKRMWLPWGNPVRGMGR